MSIVLDPLRFRRLGIARLLLLLSLPACTAWQVGSPTPAQFAEGERPELARVTRADGSQVVLEHPMLRGDTLIRTVQGGAQQAELLIPLTDVREVATRGFSAGRTIGLVAGLFVVRVAIVVAACRGGQCS